MVCLLARQEGSKRKTPKYDRHRRLWLTHNTPREQLILTRDTDPTFFDAVKSEHLQRNGSKTELRPKRTRSMANWTGSLSHTGAMRCANPESGAYTKYGSVDSDIVNYVNRYEVEENRVKTVKRTQRERPRTPLPPPFPQSPWRCPGFKPDTINEPLPSAPLMQNMRTEMVDMAAPTLQFVEEPPRIAPPPQATQGTQGDDQADLKWRTRCKWGKLK